MSKKVKDNIQEQNPYELDKLSRIPSWLIILLLKYWAAAAAIFFSVIGGIDIGLDLSQGTGNDVDSFNISVRLVVLIALFITLFINYIVRPFVRLMHNRRNNTYRYNMINIKGFLSFVLCFVYHLILSVILFFVTIFLSQHHLILDPFGTAGGSGIEPFTYGFCYIVVDLVFLFIKNVILDLRQKLKYKKEMTQEV